jgi:hypothetical protein
MNESMAALRQLGYGEPMRSSGSIRPWRKSRTFGDVYGGRSRNRVTDGIFNRAHSIDPPGAHDALPIVLEDNPSKKMVFPAPSKKIVERIQSLPEQDVAGITHLWLRRAKPSEHEAGAIPFGEFICGSRVRMIVVYPWPSDLTLHFGRTRPPSQKLREFARGLTISGRGGTDGLSSGPRSRSSAGAWITSSSTRSGTISTGTAATGRKQTIERSKPLPIPTQPDGRQPALKPSNLGNGAKSWLTRTQIRHDSRPIDPKFANGLLRNCAKQAETRRHPPPNNTRKTVNEGFRSWCRKTCRFKSCHPHKYSDQG